MQKTKKSEKPQRVVLVPLDEIRLGKANQEAVESGRSLCKVLRKTTKCFLKFVREKKITLIASLSWFLALFLLLEEIYDFLQ